MVKIPSKFKFTSRQIVRSDPPVDSGIYFINPKKVPKHDSYHTDVEKKIPDPIVRTGGIGE